MSFLDYTGLSYFYNKIKVTFIPVTGGTLTGVITASTPTGAAPYVIDTSDPENAPNDPVDRAWISANRKNGVFFEAEEDGTIYSRLVLRYPSHSTQSGWFRLRAYNTTDSSELIGTPAGVLTWKGKNLITEDSVLTPVPANAVFTDTVTTAMTSGSGNVVTAVTASNGALTVTKGSTAVLTSGNQTIAGTKTFSASPVVPTATAGDSSTKAASTAFVTNAISTVDAGVVHTTGNETIAGTKTFTNNISLADGTGIVFTNNGVAQRLIGTVLDSVEGNNAVNLRLGYGGSTYVTAGECGGQITTDNGFSYGAENVQLMADGTIVFRAGLNSGWNADYGALLGQNVFRPLKAEAMSLGTETYPWGVLYAKNFYSTGDRFSFSADAATTSAIYRTANTGNLNLYGGTWNYKDGANLSLVGAGASSNAGCFTLNATNGSAVKALKGSYADGLTWNEKQIAIDEDVVHITGTEDITGTKNFLAAPSLQRTTVTKGTAPSGATWWTLGCADKEGVATKNRLGAFEVGLDTSNNVTTYLRAYKPEHNSTTFAAVTVVYPASGNPYATAPTTPTRSTGTEIVTANYLNSLDENVVHLTGAETITGVKTHKAEICMQFTSVTKGTIPTANRYMSYRWADNAGTTMGGVQNYVYKTSGNTMTRMYAYHNDANTDKFASIGVVYPKTGDPYASCPSTPAGSTGTQIVTADFLNDTAAKYLPLAGGTMTGGIVSSTNVALQLNRASGDTYTVSANRTDTGAGIRFGIGSGGTNKGIYDTNLSKWIAYSDGTNACTQLGVTATSDDNATHIATTGWTKDVLASYATQSWVEGKGYLTSHQSITGKINVSGSRGNLAGYQTPLDVTEATSITYSSRDIIRVNASNITITVANSSSSAAWVKWVFFTEAGQMNLGNKWAWQGKEGPVISRSSLIMLIWCKTRGWALHMPAGETWS